jgi:class 3 adenylate cyclase/CheY-like chemotaxis protein
MTTAASEPHRDGVRTLSVLFTDLVGSTELLSRVGADAADRLRRRHFGLLRRAVDAHHGRQVKSLGDGLMAVFDSAGDAVGCAKAMHQAIHDEGARGDAELMPIRVGISSGDVAVEQGDCFGAAVVESSRLCSVAAPGEILVADVACSLTRGRGGHTFRNIGPIDLKGLPDPVETWAVVWDPVTRPALRAVLADDAVLVREGIARLLEDAGISVVGQAGDAVELLRCVEATCPDVAITDIRMPPTGTTEGLEAAVRIRREHPTVAVLVLSQHLETRTAQRLLEIGSGSVGYLLKERAGDVDEFVELVRRVAAGEVVVDSVLNRPAGTAARP